MGVSHQVRMSATHPDLGSVAIAAARIVAREPKPPEAALALEAR